MLAERSGKRGTARRGDDKRSARRRRVWRGGQPDRHGPTHDHRRLGRRNRRLNQRANELATALFLVMLAGVAVGTGVKNRKDIEQHEHARAKPSRKRHAPLMPPYGCTRTHTSKCYDIPEQ
jgi:hypothetical protein